MRIEFKKYMQITTYQTSYYPSVALILKLEPVNLDEQFNYKTNQKEHSSNKYPQKSDNSLFSTKTIFLNKLQCKCTPFISELHIINTL